MSNLLWFLLVTIFNVLLLAFLVFDFKEPICSRIWLIFLLILSFIPIGNIIALIAILILDLVAIGECELKDNKVNRFLFNKHFK